MHSIEKCLLQVHAVSQGYHTRLQLNRLIVFSKQGAKVMMFSSLAALPYIVKQSTCK